MKRRAASALTLVLALALAFAIAPRAEAGPSSDACRGFVTSLPAVITDQGVWCLQGDLATAITSGSAIEIDANNVTIDCNGHRIGGLAAGAGTQAFAILASQRNNVTVRDCLLRGFHQGVAIVGDSTSGHIVESNRIERMSVRGILIHGTAVSVRDNDVIDTGGSPHQGYATAIGIDSVGGSIEGNRISGVRPVAPPGWSIYGIVIGYGSGVTIRDNFVADVTAGADGAYVYGILAASDSSVVSGNRVSGGSTAAPGTSATPIYATAGYAVCRDNLIAGYADGIRDCVDGGGNQQLPLP